MSCYHPIHAFKDKSKDADKTLVVFKRSESWRGEKLELPCGQCVGCRLERARQWAVRCVHEASLYERNCFLTLTYNDKNLPKNLSLDKTHFQKFIKRLRKKYGQGIRYYHCGEYGEDFGRPHYHALVFNHDFDDKKLFTIRNNNKIYTSDELAELWPNGFSTIGEVTFESAGYVARYAMKKVTGEKSKEHYGDRIPEYTTMSRGSKRIGTGGIGKGWYDKYKSDVYPLDRIIVRGNIARPPRFYDNLLAKEDRSTFELIKIDREEKNGNRYVQDVLSDGRIVKVLDSCDERLRVKEVVKLAEISSLKREMEEQL